MDTVQVLVTEAGSSMAYHLLYLLANGDVLDQKRLSLILCDRECNKDILEGVRYELQDCCFENLFSIQISCNFCDVFQSADLAIILPPARPPSDIGNSGVEVSHSLLKARDFPCLDSAVNKTVRRKDSLFVHARGPLSKAIAVGNYIKMAYQDSIELVKLPKTEIPCFPQLSSIQICGIEGHDLYDQLILPRIYPTALNNLQQTISTTKPFITASKLEGRSNNGMQEHLYERLSNDHQSTQVLIVCALEHLPGSKSHGTIEREQTELWSRL